MRELCLRRSRVFAIAGTLCLVGSCFATATSAQSAQGQRPQFHTEVGVVRLQVAPQDADGSFVPGLGLGDFVLLVDGRPRQILDVVEIDGGSIASSSTSAPNTEGGVAGTTAVPATIATLPRDARRRFLLFLDLTQATRRSFINARRAARTFIEEVAQPYDLLGLALYSPRGGLQLVVPFSADHGAVLAALVGESPGRATEAVAEAGTDIPLEDIAASTGTSIPVADIAASLDTGDIAGTIESVEQDRVRLQREILGWALRDLGNLLTAVGGRKNIVFLSRGIADNAFQNTEFQQVMERAMDSLRRADAVINAIQPDNMPSSSVHDITRFGSNLRVSDAGSNLRSLRGGGTGRDFLNYVAEETGGVNSWYRHNVNNGFERIDRITRSYYVLAYQRLPQDPPTSRIEVRFGRPDIRVAWASSYASQPAGTGTRYQRYLQLADALDPAASVSTLRLSLRAVRLFPRPASGELAIAFEIANEEIRRLASLQSERPLALEILAMAVAPSGNIADYFSNRLELPPERFSNPDTDLTLRYYDTIVAPPGSYGVKLLVRAAGSSQLAAHSVPFEVPAQPPSEIWMSNPVLLRAQPASVLHGAGPRKGPLPPQRAGRLPDDLLTLSGTTFTPRFEDLIEAGSTVPVLVRIRNLARDSIYRTTQPKLEAFLQEASGELTPVRNGALHRSESRNGGETALVLDVPVPADLPGGSYRLLLRLTDGVNGAVVQRSVLLPVLTAPRS